MFALTKFYSEMSRVVVYTRDPKKFAQNGDLIRKLASKLANHRSDHFARSVPVPVPSPSRRRAGPGVSLRSNARGIDST